MGTFSLSLSLSFFFFFRSGYPTVWVAISRRIPQVVLRAFRPDPYPKHETYTFLFNPHLLVADASAWATSPLRVVVKWVFCGFFCFLLFLPVLLPSEIPKLPTDLLVREFPGVWKLLLLHNSLPSTGLHP